MQRTLFSIDGRVVRGAGYGRKLGFPTANLDRREYARRKIRIPLGVYAGTAAVIGIQRVYRAGIVIGPTDKKGLPKIEAHLLGFSGALYGRRVLLRLVRYLRPFRRFRGESALKTQIARDLAQVRAIMSTRRLLG